MENIYDFQVGDKVFDIRLGHGIIIAVKKTKKYPISVEIKEYGSQIYTFDGKFLEEDNCRSLYHGHDLKVTVNEKKPEREIWVNIYLYEGGSQAGMKTYPTKQEAIKHIDKGENCPKHITTMRLKPFPTKKRIHLPT